MQTASQAGNFFDIKETLEIAYYLVFILTVFISFLIFILKNADVTYKKHFLGDEKSYFISLWILSFTILPIFPFLFNLYNFYTNSDEGFGLNYNIRLILSLLTLGADFAVLTLILMNPLKKRDEVIRLIDKDYKADKGKENPLNFVNSIKFAVICLFLVAINWFLFSVTSISFILVLLMASTISFSSYLMYENKISALKKIKVIVLKKDSNIESDNGGIVGNILEIDDTMVYIKTIDDEIRWINKSDIEQIKILNKESELNVNDTTLENDTVSKENCDIEN